MVSKDLPDDGHAVVAKGKSPSGKKAAPRDDEIHGPSPNAATNLAIADIALRGGAALVRHTIERAVLGKKYGPRKAAKVIKGRSLKESLLHGALARVALRSVPGAIVVGGVLVAKTLYDRNKAREARRKGEATVNEMAEKGES